MIAIQIGNRFVRASEFRKDPHRAITTKEFFDTPDKRESRIRAYEKKFKNTRLL